MTLADNVDLRQVAKICGGYTGADIKALCREAALDRIKELSPSLNK